MNRTLTLTALLLACLACKTPEARKPESVRTGSFIDASIERNKKLNAKEQTLLSEIMSKNNTNDYIASESGFWYHYNAKSDETTGFTPDYGDIVNFSYNLKDLDGNLIYPETNFKNLDYAMDRQELFTGLREGLKLMKSGETVTFLFPSQKAYGYYGDEDKIGTNVPLICEVTVNSITKSQEN